MLQYATGKNILLSRPPQIRCLLKFGSQAAHVGYDTSCTSNGKVEKLNSLSRFSPHTSLSSYNLLKDSGSRNIKYSVAD